MTRIVALCLSLPLLCGVVATSYSQQTPLPQSKPTIDPSSPGVVVVKIKTSRATVTAVDHANRTATLRNADGEEITLDVPASVRNFDQVEVGDEVTAQYNEATAIFIRGPEEVGSGSSSAGSTEPAAARSATVQLAPLGAKPAAVESRTVEIVATVEDIDREKRTVTVRGPRGNSRTLDVGDQVQNLEKLQKGDLVTVRHTEAVAIAVTK